ncbi:MAG: FkbM family methyltransferase, partial [Xanthomonadales bacterium]|nr:FkbM family methyltransferase [Xanthomonadales bacterium]
SAGESSVACDIVQQRCLDDYYTQGKRSFLKLDVEGFEIAVLDGAGTTLRDPNLMGLLVEDDGSTKRYGEVRRAPGVLAEHGFLQYVYDPLLRSLTPRTASARGTNKLFLRDVSFATSRVKAAPRFQLVNGSI